MSPQERDVLIFSAGAVTGIAVAALLFLLRKGRPEQGADEGTDIPECPTIVEDDGQMRIEFDEPRQWTTYNNLVKSFGYFNYSDACQHDRHDEIETPEKDGSIHLITEDEYLEGGYNGYYDHESRTFYADGILANSVTDDIVDEPTALSTMGPYGLVNYLSERFETSDEPLYVENDNTFTQYEVLYDDLPYKEVTGR